MCSPNCGLNGRCTGSNTCECNEGWTGIDCLLGRSTLDTLHDHKIIEMKCALHSIYIIKLLCLKVSAVC